MNHIMRLSDSNRQRMPLSVGHWSALMNSCAWIQECKTTQITWSEAQLPLLTCSRGLIIRHNSRAVNGHLKTRRKSRRYITNAPSSVPYLKSNSYLKLLDSAPNQGERGMQAVLASVIPHATNLYKCWVILSTLNLRSSHRWTNQTTY